MLLGQKNIEGKMKQGEKRKPPPVSIRERVGKVSLSQSPGEKKICSISNYHIESSHDFSSRRNPDETHLGEKKDKAEIEVK